MTAEEKMVKARSRIAVGYPFYASTLLRMRIEEMPADMPVPCRTMATDGRTIWYDADFVENIQINALIGVTVHEVLHVICLHNLRRGTREMELWNVACDYAINHVVTSAGMSLPENALVNGRYSTMTAEEIYEELKKSGKGEGKGQSWNIGAVLDHPLTDEDGNAISKDEAEKLVKQIVAQALDSFKSCGNVPADLKSMIDNIMEPKLCWKELLARFITQISRNDYSWSKRNKRFSGKIILPILENPEIGRLVFIGDTSGSTGVEEWREFLSEMFGVLHTFNIDRIFTIYADCEVAGTEWLEDGMTPSMKGGGGTDFIPAFQYLEENDEGEETPACVIYLTDGYCSSFPEEPEYPVLWVICKNGDKSFSPPFGEVAHL